MKLSEQEQKYLFNLFFDNPNKHDRALSLDERFMQKFYYNKNKFPFNPYFDIQPIGFDDNPDTLQDTILNQKRLISEFFNTPGWILKLNKSIIN